MEDAEFKAKILEIRNAEIATHVVDDLRALHEAYGFCCSAHSEGLTCCLDFLTGDDG